MSFPLRHVVVKPFKQCQRIRSSKAKGRCPESAARLGERIRLGNHGAGLDNRAVLSAEAEGVRRPASKANSIATGQSGPLALEFAITSHPVQKQKESLERTDMKCNLELINGSLQYLKELAPFVRAARLRRG
jgi:hypothetical protein